MFNNIGSNTGLIVGIMIALLVVVALTVLILVLWWKRRSQKGVATSFLINYLCNQINSAALVIICGVLTVWTSKHNYFFSDSNNDNRDTRQVFLVSHLELFLLIHHPFPNKKNTKEHSTTASYLHLHYNDYTFILFQVYHMNNIRHIFRHISTS